MIRSELGIPLGMATGLGAQVFIIDGHLAIGWWIGAALMLILSIVIMAWIIANSEKKADEEWVYVVWNRPVAIKTTCDYRVSESEMIPAGKIGIITLEKDSYQFQGVARKDGVVKKTTALVPVITVMKNRSYFELDTNI